MTTFVRCWSEVASKHSKIFGHSRRQACKLLQSFNDFIILCVCDRKKPKHIKTPKMGNIAIKKLCKLFQRRKRILVVGLDGSGKTSVLCHLINSTNHPNECICSHSSTSTTLRPKNDIDIVYKNDSFQFKEFGGRKFDKEVLMKLQKDAKDGIIFVIDAADRRVGRLNGVKSGLFKVIETLNVKSVLVLATKKDLPNSMSGHSIKHRLDIENASYRKFDWKIKSVSGLSGDGIADSLTWFTDTQPKRRPTTV